MLRSLCEECEFMWIDDESPPICHAFGGRSIYRDNVEMPSIFASTCPRFFPWLLAIDWDRERVNAGE